MKTNAMPLIPVSVGELVDKISILKIKSDNIHDVVKLNNIKTELFELQKKFNVLNVSKKIQKEITGLENVNKELWIIEDDIRQKEKKREFDDEFVDLARSVYRINDKRAFFKKEINLKTGSLLIEEKSYSEY